MDVLSNVAVNLLTELKINGGQIVKIQKAIQDLLDEVNIHCHITEM